jgi:hypothetical protein
LLELCCDALRRVPVALWGEQRKQVNYRLIGNTRCRRLGCTEMVEQISEGLRLSIGAMRTGVAVVEPVAPRSASESIAMAKTPWLCFRP